MGRRRRNRRLSGGGYRALGAGILLLMEPLPNLRRLVQESPRGLVTRAGPTQGLAPLTSGQTFIALGKGIGCSAQDTSYNRANKKEPEPSRDVSCMSHMLFRQ